MAYEVGEFDGHLVEVCKECGFDTRNVHDLPASLQIAYSELDALGPSRAAGQRPASTT